MTSIAVVKDFQALRQVSPKNDDDFGISMIFGNAREYEAYNNHPLHQSFVAERWDTEVSRFLEIDFRTYSEAD